MAAFQEGSPGGEEISGTTEPEDTSILTFCRPHDNLNQTVYQLTGYQGLADPRVQDSENCLYYQWISYNIRNVHS